MFIYLDLLYCKFSSTKFINLELKRGKRRKQKEGSTTKRKKISAIAYIDTACKKVSRHADSPQPQIIESLGN